MSDLVDNTPVSGSYPSFLGDNTLICRTYMSFLTHNSGKSGCYLSLLTVKYGGWGTYASLLTVKHPSRGVICVYPNHLAYSTQSERSLASSTLAVQLKNLWYAPKIVVAIHHFHDVYGEVRSDHLAKFFYLGLTE